jgi:hypothetical protein
MKRIKTVLTFSFFASFLSLIVISCTSTNDETTSTTDIATVRINSPIKDTRNANKIAAKSYYYKNLVTLEKGKTTFELDDLANLVNKKVHFVVLYKADAPWAEIFQSGEFEITGDDQMNGLMAAYDLKIIKRFTIDGSNEGIVMEPKSILENPIEAALKVSMVEHVLMVNIKEVPTTTTTLTVDTEK